MNFKIVALFALIAVFFGCVAAQSQSIKLHLNEGSSNWWLAVDPRDESYDTVKVEFREAGDSRWTTAQYYPGWPYFAVASTSGRGFALPLSLRLTADNGQEVIATLIRISANSVVDTNVQYGESSTVTASPATQAPVRPSTAPTTRPTRPATQAPTEQATVKPTQPATVKPTEPATVKPTQPATVKPTEPATVKPTEPATVKPTQPATKAPTQAPTQAATKAPTQPATQAPTQPATVKPTQPATVKPTQPATQAPTQSSVDACAIVPTSVEPVKILVPLYVYPGAAWDLLIAAAKTGVKIIAIINPNSGPNANGPDSSYTTYMKKMKDAGVEMVGYVHTLWGDRDINTVTSEIGIYATKYAGVTGIFFDEASAESSDVSYYRQAYNSVLSKGFVHSILNPGTQPDKQYLDISTNIVIFENYASALSSARFDSWVKCAPSSAQKAGYQYKFSAIIHTASQSSMSSLITTAHNMGMGLVYVTDGPGGCCTYNTLTTYFAAQAASVLRLA